MAKKKHIIITRLFEFGGSNTHLKILINYLGKENCLLVLGSADELPFLNGLGLNGIDIKIQRLHHYACLNHPRIFSNIKELIHIIKSLFIVLFISIKNGGAAVTINSTEPEKLLYLLWLPLVKVNYILHTTPFKTNCPFTTCTCNHTLGSNKKIITVSEANKKYILSNWSIADTKQDSIAVIYNCLLDTPAEYQLTHIPGKQSVVTLGYLTDYKNPEIWLQVAQVVTAQRDNVSFTWVGTGPLFKKLKEATKDTPQIKFTGLSTQPYEYLTNADIYYQPSLAETHGIAVVEAMAHHLPCVVSDVGGLPESVEHQYNGLLVNPADVQNQADAIITLLNDQHLQQQYGRNSYNKYSEMFTYQAFQKKMDIIYDHV